MPRSPWHTPTQPDLRSRVPFSRGSFRKLLRRLLSLALGLASALVTACESGRVPGPDLYVLVWPAAESVGVGATLQLQAMVANAPDTTVRWRSSDAGIASVSSAGLVTGVAPGRAAITAAAGADTTRKSTSAITVYALVPEVIRLAADSFGATVGTPAEFGALVSTRTGRAVPNAIVQWSSFYALRSSVGYDVYWNRSLGESRTDGAGRARIAYAVPISMQIPGTTWRRGDHRLVARLPTGPADTAIIDAALPTETPVGLAWSSLPAMPWTRASMGAVAHGDRVYVLGGYCRQQGLAGIERYCGPTIPYPFHVTLPIMIFTPGTETWDQLPPPDSVPLPGEGALAADLPDGIHLLGGGRHLRYVPETGHWSVRTPPWPDTLPRPTMLVALQGRLYVIAESGDLRSYDPAADAWSSGAPLPRPAGWGSTAAVGGVLGGRIYVAGGGGYFDDGRQLNRYDPASNSWSTLAPLPYGRSDMGGGAAGGRFCVFGGGLDLWIGAWGFKETHCYDPAAGTWLLGPAAGLATGGMATVALGDGLYVFGGAVGQYKMPPATAAGVARLAPR